MRAFLILCDFAEAMNGKLYIMGGGWSRIAKLDQAVTMHLAAKLLVPWNRTNQRSSLSVALFDSDGQNVSFAAGPVRIEGDFEVGRPPGLPAGTDIDVPLTFKVEGLPLEIGRYRWELRIADELITDCVFDVVATI